MQNCFYKAEYLNRIPVDLVFYSSAAKTFNLPEGITSYKQGTLHSTKLENFYTEL